MVESVKISDSTSDGKKMMAIFYTDGTKTKTIHFGQKGADDFTKKGDSDQKQRYLDRHRKNENWNSPQTAGALSRWILWNKKSLTASISDFKKRFNLN